MRVIDHHSRTLYSLRVLTDTRIDPMISIECTDFSCTQYGIGMAQRNDLSKEGQQLSIPLLWLMPGESRATIGIRRARHTNLCTIVDARCARHCHLEQGAEPQCALVAVDSPQSARCIMAVHQV